MMLLNVTYENDSVFISEYDTMNVDYYADKVIAVPKQEYQEYLVAREEYYNKKYALASRTGLSHIELEYRTNERSEETLNDSSTAVPSDHKDTGESSIEQMGE